MRKIKLTTWTVRVPKYEDGKAVGIQEGKESLLTALETLIAAKKPEEIPRGLDKFRLFGRLAKAFDRAVKAEELVLEEADYSFLKKMIESDVPSSWGLNPSLADAIEAFLEAKEE